MNHFIPGNAGMFVGPRTWSHHMYDTLMTPLLTPALVLESRSSQILVLFHRYMLIVILRMEVMYRRKDFFFPGPTEESSLTYASSD